MLKIGFAADVPREGVEELLDILKLGGCGPREAIAEMLCN